VRVEPRILPPDDHRRPDFGDDWPKAGGHMTAGKGRSALRAPTVQAVRHDPAPNVSAVRRIRGSTP